MITIRVDELRPLLRQGHRDAPAERVSDHGRADAGSFASASATALAWFSIE